MTLNSSDVRRLIAPLLTMLALMLTGALFAWNTRNGAEEAEQQLQQSTEIRNRSEQRLRQVRTEEQDIKERSALLQRLQVAGIAGDERRLDWIEMLRDLQRDLRIPGMKYEFGAQTPINGSNGWYASPLRVQFRLLHELDLLRALERIEREAKALVITRNCKVGSLPPSGNDGSGAQLLADCEMEWLTIRLPETAS